MGRLGPDNFEDLVGAILLECLQLKAKGTAIGGNDVVRAADRVRQRINRAHRLKVMAAPELARTDTVPPEEEIELVLQEFQTILTRRSPKEALLFQRYYLDGVKNIPVLATELGVSKATVYRWLQSIRDEFLAIRDMKTPPHWVD